MLHMLNLFIKAMCQFVLFLAPHGVGYLSTPSRKHFSIKCTPKCTPETDKSDFHQSSPLNYVRRRVVGGSW